MGRFNKIIFLDEEGTGLSPYADALMKQKLNFLGVTSLEVDSRGNVVLFPEPVNQKMGEIARQKGMELDNYTARELESSDFSESTLVLALDSESKQKAYDRFPNAVNVYMLREFVGESGDIRLPLGGSIDEYITVCNVVDRVTNRLLEHISGSPL